MDIYVTSPTVISTVIGFVAGWFIRKNGNIRLDIIWTTISRYFWLFFMRYRDRDWLSLVSKNSATTVGKTRIWMCSLGSRSAIGGKCPLLASYQIWSPQGWHYGSQKKQNWHFVSSKYERIKNSLPLICSFSMKKMSNFLRILSFIFH